MSTHELLYKAIKIATKAHKKQTDKYDAPYLGHVFRVMNAGKTIDEKIVGILHDVVEDHPEFSLEYLKEKGFPDYILEAIECLTKREMEVLKLICDGLSSKKICEKLFISINTVETHRKKILMKLNVKNSAGVVKYAMENHMIG